MGAQEGGHAHSHPAHMDENTFLGIRSLGTYQPGMLQPDKQLPRPFSRPSSMSLVTDAELCTKMALHANAKGQTIPKHRGTMRGMSPPQWCLCQALHLWMWDPARLWLQHAHLRYTRAFQKFWPHAFPPCGTFQGPADVPLPRVWHRW